MVYGYIRVSTDHQDVNNQKIGIIKKAELLGLKIESWIADEGVSGTKEPEKRELGKLLKKIKKADVIIASEISRLGRSLFMVMRILEHCMNNDCRVYTVKDNYELGNNITSKVLAFAFGLAAEIEREMISKRTIEALQRKKSEGMILGRPKGRRSNTKKCDKLKDDIIAYNNLGLPVIRIAKLLKVHRLTVSTWMKENGIEGSHGSFDVSTRSAAHVYREIIEVSINQGLDYHQILEKITVDYKGKCTITSLRHYIQNDDHLYQLFAKKQDDIRIKANGGLRVNKRINQ